MKIKIKITKEILEKSMMCGTTDPDEIGENCAFALATREIFPNAIVGNGFILALGWGNTNEGYIRLPSAASAYIRVFDMLKENPKDRLSLPEISCEVDVNSTIIDKIGISELYKVLSESKTLELVSI